MPDLLMEHDSIDEQRLLTCLLLAVSRTSSSIAADE